MYVLPGAMGILIQVGAVIEVSPIHSSGYGRLNRYHGGPEVIIWREGGKGGGLQV